MREIRLSGSEGGGVVNPTLPTPIFPASLAPDTMKNDVAGWEPGAKTRYG